MERLTAKNKHGKPIIKDWPNYMEFDIINRLAAYEDTGLEPEEIMQTMNVVKSAVSVFEDFGVDRLRELIQADREGRCKIVPCKLGEPIYLLKSGEIIRNYGVQWHFTDHDEQTFGTLSLYGDFVTANDFGKTVFLTRADAEAALRRDQDG